MSLFLKNTGLGILRDFLLTMPTEELKRSFRWITWRLSLSSAQKAAESVAAALQRAAVRPSVRPSVPRFTQQTRTTHRQQTPKASSSEPVFTAGDRALTILYTASPN